MKKLMAFSLALTMIFSAVSCSDKKESQVSEQTQEVMSVSQTMYRSDYIPVPDDCVAFMDVMTDSDGRMLVEYIGGQLPHYEYKIAVYNEDNSIAETISIETEGDEFLTHFSLDENGNFRAFSEYTESSFSSSEINDEETYAEYWEDSETELSVKTYDKTGKMIDKVSFGDLDGNFVGGESSIGYCGISGDHYMITLQDLYFILDSEGKIAEKCMPDPDVISCSYDYNGKVVMWRSDGFKCGDTLAEAKNSKVISFPDDKMINGSCVMGDERFPMYAELTDGFYGLSAGNQVYKVIDYSASKLSTGNMSQISPISEGKYFATSYEGDGLKFMLLTVRPDDYTEERETIVVGIHGIINSDDYDLSSGFARQNDDYEVEFREYPWDSDTLKQDILTDNSPDVFVYDDIADMYNYVNMGAFADYDSLSEQYGGINSDFFMPNIVEALKYKGKLYAMGNDFQPSVTFANREVIGREYQNMTMEQFLDIAENMPENMCISEMYSLDIPGMFFSYLVPENPSEWIDMENYTCDFDNEKFIRVLNLCRDARYIDAEQHDESFYLSPNAEQQMGAEMEGNAAMIYNKKSLIYNTITSDFRRLFNDTIGLHGMKLDDVTYLTPPNKYRQGRCSIYRKYSVLNNGKNQQGGWEFVNYVLSYDVQTSSNNQRLFVTGKDAFETNIQKQVKEMREQGSSTNKFNGYEYTVEYNISDEDVNYILDYICSCSQLSVEGFDLHTILAEEFEKFENGETTAEECAKHTQDRVTIYLSEHAG